MTAPETLPALREEKERLTLQREVQLLRARQREEEAFWEAWGDWVDPLGYLWDEPGFGPGDRRTGRPTLKSDRSGGTNRPIFETETELAMIRGAGRLLAETPIGRGALESLTSFVIGEGLTTKIAALPGCPDGLAAAVQAVLDEFDDRNQWEEDEEEVYTRPIRDGDALLALFGDGPRASLRFVDPELICEPADPHQVEAWLGCEAGDWTFGVYTPDGDARKHLGYYIQWDDAGTDWDYLPAERAVFIKRNVDGNIKRGLSDFYAVQEHLTDIGKLERNVAKGAAVLSAIIGIRSHPAGTSKAQVESFLQANAWRVRTQTSPAGSRTHYTQKIEPGSWLDVPEGREYHQSPLANQGVGDAFVKIEQALLRTVGSRWDMPEYLISADASNANYSSTLVAESPFVKFCKRQQRRRVVPKIRELRWKVLGIAVAGGAFARFGIETPAELRRAVRVTVTAPIVEARDRPAETTRRLTLSQAGILSDAQWAEEEGYDLDEQRTRGARRLAQQPGVPTPGLGTLPVGAGERGSGRTGASQQESLQAAADLLWAGYPGSLGC